MSKFGGPSSSFEIKNKKIKSCVKNNKKNNSQRGGGDEPIFSLPPDIKINHLQELSGTEEGDEKFIGKFT